MKIITEDIPTAQSIHKILTAITKAQSVLVMRYIRGGSYTVTTLHQQMEADGFAVTADKLNEILWYLSDMGDIFEPHGVVKCKTE